MSTAPLYYCPMHRDVHESAAGKCPHCGMALVAEGTRFALLHHMSGGLLHFAVMVAAMLAVMAAAMMIMR